MTKMAQRCKEPGATIVKSPQGRSTDGAAIREEPLEDTDSDNSIAKLSLIDAEAGA
jgi:hypothetical protein